MRKAADGGEDLAEQIRSLRKIVSGHLRNKKLHPVKKYDKIARNLLSYVRIQLTRLSKYATMPLDHVALSTRNLIEVALWAEFITSSRGNIDLYHDQVFIDVLEICPLVKPDYTHAKVAEIYKSNRHTVLKKNRAKDKFWFKFCSKIIHPTAWSINIGMKPGSKFVLERKVELASYGLGSAIRAIATLTGLPLPSYIKD